MNLTPEQKAVGRENFFATIGSDLTRREFLMAGLAAGVVSGGGLGAFYFGYGKSVPNPVRVGVIGTGDEGSVLIGAITPGYVEVKAIADIRPYSIYRAFHGDCYSPTAQAVRCGLMAKYGWKTEEEARKHVKVYGDYKEMLADAKKLGLEAVIIALPLHLHCEAAVAAMEAGLHVLTEKLMAHSVGQCKQMAQTAKKAEKLLVTGHQRHYNILYENAMDTIKRGLLGDLHYIRAQWHRGNLPGRDSWSQPLPPGVKKPDEDKQADQLAKELASWKKARDKAKSAADIALWSAKIRQKEAQIADIVLHKEELARKYGYEDRTITLPGYAYNRPAIEELIRWRLWDRTGGGLMAELGSHQMDAASLFISAMHGGQKQMPLSVAAAANRPLFPPDREVEDHVYCILEFPAPGYDPDEPVKQVKRIGVQYSSINGNGFGGYGEIVFGTKGTLILEQEKEVMLFKDSDTASKVSVTKDKDGGPTLDTQASGPAQAAAVGQAAIGPDVSRGYTEEIEHWAWCIRNPAPENQPRCGPKVALGDAVIALTTNLAARRGMRVDFKKEWFDPDHPATPEEDLKA